MLNFTIKIINVEIKIICTVIISFFMIAFLFLQSGCAMDGARYLVVVDENGNQLNGILIVPLYSKSFGIGVGPDGKGFFTKSQLIVTKPFVFNSGEDLMSKKISTKGVNLPPFIFVGSSNYVDNWLFIKKGFTPKLVQSSDIYGEAPIVLTKSSGNDSAKLIDMLLASKHDQNVLKKQFGVEWGKDEITVVFDETDIVLLKAHRGLK